MHTCYVNCQPLQTDIHTDTECTYTSFEAGGLLWQREALGVEREFLAVETCHCLDSPLQSIFAADAPAEEHSSRHSARGDKGGGTSREWGLVCSQSIVPTNWRGND